MAWLIVLLVILGLIMLAVEVIIPGLIVGALGLCALFAAVIIAYIEFGFEIGSLALAIIVLISCAGFALWLYLFPRTFLGQRLMLNAAIKKTSDPAGRTTLIGQTGVALTHLRPSGTARIDGKRLDVVAEGGYVAENEPVRVIAADGMRVVVRAEHA